MHKWGKMLIAIVVGIVIVAGFWFGYVYLKGKKADKEQVPSPKASSEVMQPISHGLSINIYLDATLSMKGFVEPGTGTQFCQTIQGLESTSQILWPDGQTKLFRFGTLIAPLTRQDSLRAVLPEFYSDPDIFMETNINKVIEAASTVALTVIVTDLFEKDSDVALLVKQLIEKYLSRDLTIGIVGIKSSFQGKIYDVGIQRLSFDYSSGKDPQSFRPFYMLVMGKHRDVVAYYETLANNVLKEFSGVNFVALSRYIVSPATPFTAKPEITEKMVEVSNLMDSRTRDARVRQFVIRDNAPKTRIVFPFAFSPVKYAVPFDEKDIVVEVASVTKHGLKDDRLSAEERKQLLTATVRGGGRWTSRLKSIHEFGRLEFGTEKYVCIRGDTSTRPESLCFARMDRGLEHGCQKSGRMGNSSGKICWLDDAQFAAFH